MAFFVAKGIHFLKPLTSKKALFLFQLGNGWRFRILVLKSFEYYEKLEAGLHMDYNSFFRFYWLLTGFHFIHVLVGLVILLLITFSIKKKNKPKLPLKDISKQVRVFGTCAI